MRPFMRVTLARPKLLESVRTILLHAWLADGPCYPVQYSPTNRLRLLLVEQWFGLITRRTARRGPDHAVRELSRGIATFAVG
jgi:hypothetical protein